MKTLLLQAFVYVFIINTLLFINKFVFFPTNLYNYTSNIERFISFIHSFIICLFRKHSPYKNCANYA